MKRTTTEMPVRSMAFGSVLICLVTLAVNASGGEEAEQKAILKVKRRAAFSGLVCKMDVYVNDEKVGTLSNGETKEFEFLPRKDGKNKLFMEFVGGASVKSPVLEVVLRAGETATATTNVAIGFSVNSLTIELTTMTISYSPDFVEKELSSEIVETPAGTKRIIKRSRTIEHGLTLTETKSLEKGGNLDLSVIAGEIRTKLERSLSKSFKDSETVEQAIEIDGKELPKAKLIWVEKYRTGTATLTVNSVAKRIPFEFRENIELKCVRVE